MSAYAPPLEGLPALSEIVPASRRVPLFERFPELAGAVPFRPLVHAPTPVERIAVPGPLGRDGLWIKRDDLVSPLYGGNKVRRFEYLFADAAEKGRRTLVTAGGLASTQVTATILLGKALGFEVAAIFFDQPISDFLRRAIALDAAASPVLVYGGGYAATAWRGWTTYRKLDRPYLIAPGASSPLALLGYVDAALELGEQVARGEMPRPDRIVLPAGSGGTAAALALGCAILGWPTVITAVRITDPIACNRAVLGLWIERTRALLKKRSPTFSRLRLPGVHLEVDGRALGKGYGHSTPEAEAAIEPVRAMIGVPGEVTYSGKAVAALGQIAAERPSETILFWNTLSSRRPVLPGVDDLPGDALADVRAFEKAHERK
jgi:1-aminocyclopropane-1-carboxylate deaminase/D-cysteine desulfhydrase-like pyridoxal-dependent ACC family enzyme